MDQLRQDLRYAARMLSSNKTWTIMAIVTLAFGIGPLTALYSFFDRAYFAKLPVPDADDVVRFREVRQVGSQYTHPIQISDLSLPADLQGFEEMRKVNQTLTDLFAYEKIHQPVDTIANGTSGKANIEFVSGNYFSALKLTALRGRMLLPDEDTPSAAPVAVISEPYWEKVFARSPDVIGASITVLRKPYTIVGVWPSSFIDATGTQTWDDGKPAGPEIMVPLVHDDPAATYRCRFCLRSVHVMGRRKPGVTYDQIRANFEPFVLERLNKDPRYPAKLEVGPVAAGLQGVWYEFALTRSSDAVMVLLVTVSIVGFFAIPLILACTNIATFLLARAEDRRVEIGVRLAIGAGRGQLFRQLLTESVLLSILGGIAGLLVGYWWTKLFAHPPFSVYSDLTLNWRAFGIAMLIALPTGIVCGILPARAATGDALTMLRSFGAGFSRAPSKRPRNLIVVQVAMSLLGLIGVGLMVRTIRNIQSVDVGFNTEQIAIFTVDPAAGMITYDGSQMAAISERIVQALSAMRGVESVSFSDQPILTGAAPIKGAYARDSNGRLQTKDVHWYSVHPGFFKTLDIPLRLGRAFTETETLSPQKVVVSAAFAQTLFPNMNPIGLRFSLDLKNIDAYEVVGVAADAKPSGASKPVPTVYLHHDCCSAELRTFAVRTSGNPAGLLPAIRTMLTTVDSNLPVTKLTTPKAEMEESYLSGAASAKFILNYYTALSTVLAMTGLFGLMSHIIAGRTKEIGIRMALGARPRRMLLSVIAEALRMIIPGIFLGLVAALSLGRMITSYLYDVAPHDPMTIVLAIISMALIAAAASYIPARRASRVDPIVALRHE